MKSLTHDSAGVVFSLRLTSFIETRITVGARIPREGNFTG